MRFRCDIEQGDLHGYKDEDASEKSSAAWIPNKNGKEINVRMYSEDGGWQVGFYVKIDRHESVGYCFIQGIEAIKKKAKI